MVGEDPEGKAPNRLRQALKNRDNGGEAAGPRLKSVGCGKVNGGLRGLDVKGLGSLPIPEGLGLGSAIAGRRAALLGGYMGTMADCTVQGTWVEQERASGGERPKVGRQRANQSG